MTNLSQGYMVMEWEGSYGNFSYSYTVPAYSYDPQGGCLPGDILVSNNDCSNTLMLENDGEKLIITQLP